MRPDISVDMNVDTSTPRSAIVRAELSLKSALRDGHIDGHEDGHLGGHGTGHEITQQWSVAWRDYVHEVLGDHPTDREVRRRRRNLLLDLSLKATPVSISELRVLSGRVAEAYAKKTPRTLQRDIDALEEQGLVVKMGNGYLANRGRILAFLPARRDGHDMTR